MTPLWIGFLTLVVLILALDLGVLNRKAHVVSMKEAFAFTIGCVVLALCFAGFVHWAYDAHFYGLGLQVDAVDGVRNTGRLAMVKFITGYIVELSLSADNVFVIALLFQGLRIPEAYQHRVLFWGILGALVMRGAMIVGGAALVARYHWILYLFGAFLVYTAIRLLIGGEEKEQEEESRFVAAIRRFLPVSDGLDGAKFLTRVGGRLHLTPLAIALTLVETTDLVFALDSIPAIFAITTDAFLVFTSNVFAILGLRSLYFALAGAIAKFRYLKVSLAAILGIVGAKMLVADLLKKWIGPSFNYYLLALVALILLAGIVASIRKQTQEPQP